MIINMDRQPKYSLYYIGAEIIRYLKQNREAPIELIHNELKNVIDNTLHIDFLYYALDWLFMLALIDVKENRVILC